MSATQDARELLSTYPGPGQPTFDVARVRSTLLSSAIVELRERGLFDRYWANLDAAARPEIETLIAGVWMPARVAMAHYAACDSLGMGSQEQLEMGRGVGKRIHETILSMLTLAARGTGVSMWTPLGIYTRLYSRIFEGGMVHVYKTGPKDAEVHVARMPFLRFQYFRQSWLGVHQVGVVPFSQRAFVRIAPERDPDACSFRLSWV